MLDKNADGVVNREGSALVGGRAGQRFCQMILNRSELDGIRVLKLQTVDLIFQSRADGKQFWIDRGNNLFAVFMVQTEMVQTEGYRSPEYKEFRQHGIGAIQ